MAPRDAVNRRTQALLIEQRAFQLIERAFKMVAGGGVGSRIRCTLAEDQRSPVAVDRLARIGGGSQAVRTTFTASVSHTQ